MSYRERARAEELGDWYLEEQLDFDKRLIQFRYETIRSMLVGPKGLELGPAEGSMTHFLVQDFDELTVVEGSSALLSKIPNQDNLTKIHSLFEDFEPQEGFDSIIMEHILEHVDDPTKLLKRAKTWLRPNGKIFLGVPNGNSIHRLAAVKMGLLTHPCQLNARDHALGHRRVYTPQTFRNQVVESGLNVMEIGGVYFKPLSNGQIQDNWSEEMMQGFFELGKDFPDFAAEIYAICQ